MLFDADHFATAYLSDKVVDDPQARAKLARIRAAHRSRRT